MQECEPEEISSSNTSMDISDLFMQVLRHQRSTDAAHKSDPVCLPSARSYKDVLDENLQLHSQIFSLKIQNEKLLFMNTNISDEILKIRNTLSEKKSKYKNNISDKDRLIEELRSKLEEEMLNVKSTYVTKQVADNKTHEEHIKSLEDRLAEVSRQYDTSLEDLATLRAELLNTKDSLSSLQISFSQTQAENKALRQRLSAFGIPSPPSNMASSDPPQPLLLSKFCLLSNN